MEVRGSVTDRPWGLTLGTIALRRHTGQLTIDADGKRYGIAFDDGAIVGASSPMAADAIARVALTNHFITSTQVPDITRRLALSPERDEVDVLAEVVRCSPEQVLKLRHRLVAQRAARTFSLERGDFVLGDRISLPVFPGVAVDHRHVIYLGVRTNVAELRLIDDLRQLGSYFVLKPEAIDEIPRFGFEASANPVIEALKLGTSLPELEASHRELDPRSAQAIIYALVSCSACLVPPRSTTQAGVAHATSEPAVARRTTAHGMPSAARTGTGPRESRTGTGPRESRTGTGPRESRTGTGPRESRTGTGPRDPAAPHADELGQPPRGRPSTPAPFIAPSTTRPSPDSTISPFSSRTSTLSSTSYATAAAPDAGTNTPAATRPRATSDPGTGAPGVARPRTPTPAPAQMRTPTRPSTVTFGESRPVQAGSSAPTTGRPATSRTATSDAEVARSFTDQRTPTGFPDQRTPTGFPEQRTPGFGEQRTPADQRTPTDPSLSRTPTGNPATSRVSTDNAAAAESAFKRGELAMKRDQPGEAILEYKAACDLNPQEVDYAGMLAWAKFCAAGDKQAIGADTRKILERAVHKSLRPERARFYLGRVERMLGRDKEALRHFQEVLDLKPNHADAASEIRAIEARLHAAAKGTGLFGRKR
jgi:hypothetical protein